MQLRTIQHRAIMPLITYIACIRLLCWHPCGDQQQKRRKCLQASHPDLSCRFVKEGSLGKSQLLADIDHVDVTARTESLNNVPGQPVMPEQISLA